MRVVSGLVVERHATSAPVPPSTSLFFAGNKMKPRFQSLKHLIKFKNDYLKNQIVLDLKLREKKQYDNLKVRLLDNKIPLNNEKKLVVGNGKITKPSFSHY